MADGKDPKAPAPAPVMPPTPPEQPVSEAEALQNRQRRAAQEAAAAERSKLDETVPGGRYILDDGVTVVDANGKPLSGKGD